MSVNKANRILSIIDNENQQYTAFKSCFSFHQYWACILIFKVPNAGPQVGK